MERGEGAVDRGFLLLLGGMVLFGLVMLTSASFPLGLSKFGNGYYYLIHQVIFGLLPGLVGFAIAYKLPYTIYRRYAGAMLFVSIALLLLVFIPGIGQEFGGSRSWIMIGSFSMQPSEIVKLTFMFYLAGWLEKRSQHELKDFSQGVLPFLCVLGVVAFFLIQQPDTGSMAIIVLMALATYFSAGAPLKYLAGVGVAGAAGLALLIKLTPYRAARFITFLHPELDPQGVGYHINQALLAIGSGGLFGRGYGHSLQKFQYLPEVAGDSIFAVIGEELGLLFTWAFLTLNLAFLWRGFKIAERAPDGFGRYLVVGIMTWFGVQAVVNIGAMVGLLPITGVPLPLVSYGGTALAVSLTAMGIVANVSSHAKH
ncbi:TPA: putative lipid II flippase FtsW [Candidatus Uhrbacteria bacterium]|nr:putative lipid II flippase FtsW [Candidatus Uhrbacteria bacterium]